MTHTLTKEEVSDSLELFEFAPGRSAPISVLRTLLPDVETTLFFGMVYKLSPEKLGKLLRKFFKTTVVKALLKGAHSVDLQGYVIDLCERDYLIQQSIGDITQIDWEVPAGYQPPDTEVLGQLWEAAAVDVADSIATVAAKISSVIDALPSKYGTMVFTHMRKLNAQRGTIGQYAPHIHHQQQAKNLVIFDVSGSVSSTTVQEIVGEVVGMAYKANASLAIVSNNAFYWDAGAFTVNSVLAAAEYGGTRYEKLLPLLHQHWGTVITVADYDSSWSALELIRDEAVGSIEEIIDISLVGRPTFLAETLGSIAKSIRPVLIGKQRY